MTTAPRLWLPAGLSLMMVGWGANQFASLLAFYRQEHGFSELAVTAMLGIYVLGLIPALLVTGPVSDFAGRRRLTLGAILLSILASAIMACGGLGAAPLFVGRFVAGVATGIAMAAATSWIKELSQRPWAETPAAGAGARRASLLATAGFWLGPVVSGLVANWAPHPGILPCVLHMVLCVPLLAFTARLPETRPRTNRPPGILHLLTTTPVPRFRRVVAPAAPWVFGSGTIGFAVVPGMIDDVGGSRVLYATAAVALTLGCGVAVQPLARRLDSDRSARALLASLGTVLAGLLVAVSAVVVQDPWTGLAASAVLGAGYGLLMVSGLLETHRAAGPHQMGALTGRYYTLAYLGFLTPTVLAFAGRWADPVAILAFVAVLCAASIATVAANAR
ncbi:MFS transporter [Arthrobacter sp. KK5.5]|uniref:MFS transporter n=1 Tax=Arthrobacter sp. KK5.5 TaxID=3373084 RepID=UPI003EE4D8F8